MAFMQTIRMKVNMIICSYSSIVDNQSTSLSLSMSSWEGEVEKTIEILPNVIKNRIIRKCCLFYQVSHRSRPSSVFKIP